MRLSVVLLSTILSGTALAQDKSYKVVDPADLEVSARKYSGKDIEIRGAQCYYADLNEYRCITDVWVTVFAASIEPPELQSRVQDDCDQVRIATRSAKCKFNVRLTVDEKRIREDTVSGNQQRTIILAPVIELIQPKRTNR